MIHVLYKSPPVGTPDVHTFYWIAFITEIREFDDFVVPFVEIFMFFSFSFWHAYSTATLKRGDLFKDTGFIDYVPRPSFAFFRSSVDRHLRHCNARGALDAPHFMHIFLLSSLFSDSGNRAIVFFLPEDC